MPYASEDAELTKLQHAMEFIRDVRDAQRGLGLFGPLHIKPEQQQAVTETISNSLLIRAVKESTQLDVKVNYLAERFEEMCRRQGATMDSELRPYVAKLLAVELWINHIALASPAEKLVSVTLYRGAIGPELTKEFERFGSAPSIFKAAARSYSRGRRWTILPTRISTYGKSEKI